MPILTPKCTWQWLTPASVTGLPDIQSSHPHSYPPLTLRAVCWTSVVAINASRANSDQTLAFLFHFLQEQRVQQFLNSTRTYDLLIFHSLPQLASTDHVLSWDSLPSFYLLNKIRVRVQPSPAVAAHPHPHSSSRLGEEVHGNGIYSRYTCMRTDLALFQGCLAFLLHFLIPFTLPDGLLTFSSPWKRDEWNTSNCLFNSGTWMSNRHLKLNHTWFLHKIPSWWSLLEPIFSLSCSNSLSVSHPWQPLCTHACTHTHTHSISLTLHLTPLPDNATAATASVQATISSIHTKPPGAFPASFLVGENVCSPWSNQ